MAKRHFKLNPDLKWVPITPLVKDNSKNKFICQVLVCKALAIRLKAED